MSYYIYAYLDDNQQPYYIGKGKNKRAWCSGHSVSLPEDKSKIVIMESNLTEVGALALERFYIRWYGRKNIDIDGILDNTHKGGHGQGPKKEMKPRRKVQNKPHKSTLSEIEYIKIMIDILDRKIKELES